MKIYLMKRQQWVRVSSKISMWKRIMYGVFQGSILGPLLFKYLLKDLFLSADNSNLSNYAGEETPDISSIITLNK